MIKGRFTGGSFPRVRGVGSIQGGVSSANLREILIERGLSSSNLASALQASPAKPAESSTPASAPATSENKKSNS